MTNRKKVVIRDIDPKSVSTQDFYGFVNLATREWKVWAPASKQQVMHAGTSRPVCWWCVAVGSQCGCLVPLWFQQTADCTCANMTVHAQLPAAGWAAVLHHA
jgi:hypothetical protein